MILTALPTALDVEEGIVQAAVRETAETLEQMDRTAAADRESAWRASFKPHGYLCGSTRTTLVHYHLRFYRRSGAVAENSPRLFEATGDLYRSGDGGCPKNPNNSCFLGGQRVLLSTTRPMMRCDFDLRRQSG